MNDNVVVQNAKLKKKKHTTQTFKDTSMYPEFQGWRKLIKICPKEKKTIGKRKKRVFFKGF